MEQLAKKQLPIANKKCALWPQLHLAPRPESKQPALPEFRPLTLADQAWLAPLLAAEGSLSTDGCFGTYYLWGAAYGQTVAQEGSRALFHYQTGKEPFFAYPAGSGDLSTALDRMEQKADQTGAPLIIKGVTESQKEALEAARPGYFTFSESSESADYIYEAEQLATLAGRKLHSKRNHCNRFEENWPDWRFEELQRHHFPQCLALLQQWEEQHAGEPMQTQSAELVALNRLFADYEQLNVTGGALFVNDELIAFTIGEPLPQQGFDVRFEKARSDIQGAYPMINREFVRFLLSRDPNLRYINREEDLGLENLRKAKESYRPAFLLQKYVARAKNK